MTTPIEKMEEAGVLDASRLSEGARDQINKGLTEERVQHLIEHHKNLPGAGKKWYPEDDGSIL